MLFHFLHLDIPDLILITPRVFEDERGFFLETYKCSEFAKFGIKEVFVQDNQSRSRKSVLRGLHYQKKAKAQGKLVRVIAGEIYDAAVDIRKTSPTFGKWLIVRLSSQNKHMLYVPAGFAHGFCVTSNTAVVAYKATAEYAPEEERGIVWNDSRLQIAWPVASPVLSPRDANLPSLEDADNDF